MKFRVLGDKLIIREATMPLYQLAGAILHNRFLGCAKDLNLRGNVDLSPSSEDDDGNNNDGFD